MGVYVFGGGPVLPAQVDYISYVFGTAPGQYSSPLQLIWPLSLSGNPDATATIMEFNASSGTPQIYLADATQVSVGQSFVAINRGTQTLTFFDFNGGNQLFTLAAGISQYVYLTDNSTQEGEWGSLVYGAGTSSADANVLAGYGLISLPNAPNPNTLNVEFESNFQTSNLVLDPTSRAQLYVLQTSCTTVTLPQSLRDGFFCILYNQSQTAITLTPQNSNVKINGSSATVPLLPSQSCFLICNGLTPNNYTTAALQQVVDNPTTFTTVDVAGGAAYIDLSFDQLNNDIIYLTGTLTAPCIVYFGNPSANTWVITNNAQGSSPGLYTLSISGGDHTAPIGASYVLQYGTTYNAYIAATSTVVGLNMISPVYNNQFSINTGQPLIWSQNAYPVYTGMSIVDMTQVQNNTLLPIGDKTVVLSQDFSAPVPESLLYNTLTYYLIQGVAMVGPDNQTGNDVEIQFWMDGGEVNYGTLAFLTGSTYSGSFDIVPISFNKIIKINDHRSHSFEIVGHASGTSPNGRFNGEAASTGPGVAMSEMTITRLIGAST
jgi:hypothetical protein